MNQHTNISAVTPAEGAPLIDHFTRGIEKLENVIAFARERLAEISSGWKCSKMIIPHLPQCPFQVIKEGSSFMFGIFFCS